MQTLTEADWHKLAELTAVNKQSRISVMQCEEQLRQGFVDRKRVEKVATYYPKYEHLVIKYLVYMERLLLDRPSINKKVLTQQDWERIDEYDLSTG